MGDQADLNGGWAPLDPELPAGAHPPQPHPQGPGRPQPHPQGQYAPQAYPQGPYPPQPYAQGAYPPQPHPPQDYPAGPLPYGPGYGQPPVKRPWTVAPPPGVPFHRMARTAAQRWWQLPAGTLAIVIGGFGAMLALLLVGLVVYGVATGETDLLDGLGDGGDRVFPNATADLAFNLAAVAVFLPFVLIAPLLVQRRRPGALSSVAGRLRLRWLLLCALLAAGFCALSYGLTWAASLAVDDPSDGADTWVGWGRFIGPALVILLLVPVQSAAEEYFFRGWLLQGIAGCTLENRRGAAARALSVVFRTPWPAIVISGAFFVSLHGYTGWGMLDIFGFAVVACWLAVRTGGLEASIAMHVLNNLMAFLLPAAVGELDIEQGAVAWQYVAADLTAMAVYAAAVLLLARRLRVQRVTGEAPPPA